VITNFTFLALKKADQNRASPIQPQKCMKYPKMFPIKTPKVGKSLSKKCILWAFFFIVWGIR